MTMDSFSESGVYEKVPHTRKHFDWSSDYKPFPVAKFFQLMIAILWKVSVKIYFEKTRDEKLFKSHISTITFEEMYGK